MMDQMRIDFEGSTYAPDVDRLRLASAQARVLALMADGEWRTLAEIAVGARTSEAGASARLRDLRKARYGKQTVERERLKCGRWRYRLIWNPETRAALIALLSEPVPRAGSSAGCRRPGPTTDE